MSCEGCGHCCRLVVIDAYIENEDIRTWLNYHQHIQATKDKIYIFSPCIHLNNDNKCNIYDRRPNNCRQFKEQSKNCKEAKKLCQHLQQ